MQACAKDTCMGYSKNFKNDPSSFVKGPQDSAAVDFITQHGIYTSPGALDVTGGQHGEKFLGNPFTDPNVSAVEIVRTVNENSQNVIYDVYVVKKGMSDKAALTRFSVSKADNSITGQPVLTDHALKDTPMAKSISEIGTGKYNTKLSAEANMFFNHAFEPVSRKTIGLVSLREMREFFKTDNIVRIADGRFTFPDYGKYRPNVTFIVSDTMPYSTTYSGGKDYLEPVPYHEYDAVAREYMNIPFDANPDGITAAFGNYRLSKNGKPVLEVCDCEDASHVLIKADWGGAFSKASGIGSFSEKEVRERYPEVLMFRRAKSNGGGSGNDYYVIKNTPEMKAYYADLIEKEQIQENSKTYEKMFQSYAARVKYMNSEIYKPLVIDDIHELEEKYRQVPLFADKPFEYKDGDVAFYDNSLRKLYVGYKDAEEIIEHEIDSANNRLIEYRMRKAEYDQWKQRIDDFVASQGDTITETKPSDFDPWDKMPEANVHSEHPGEYDNIFREKISYTEDGFYRLTKAYEIINENRNYKAICEERAALEQTGIDAGLPSEFKNYHRDSGLTNISETLYLDQENRIVEPDSLDPKNWNHRHHFDSERRFINWADGYQHWGQILPGDTIVTLSKECTREPLIFEMPYVGSDMNDETIARIRQWEESAIRRHNPSKIVMDENYGRYIHGIERAESETESTLPF